MYSTPRFATAIQQGTEAIALLTVAYDMIQQMADDMKAVLDPEITAADCTIRIEATLTEAARRGLIPHPPPDYSRLTHSAMRAEMLRKLAEPENRPNTGLLPPNRKAETEQKLADEAAKVKTTTDLERTVFEMVLLLRSNEPLPFARYYNWKVLKPARERFAEILLANPDHAKQAVLRKVLRDWFKAKILASVEQFERDTTWSTISHAQIAELVEWTFAKANSETVAHA